MCTLHLYITRYNFTKMNSAFIFCLLLFSWSTFLIEGNKRILLNDPDVVAERMNRFEQTVAQLKADNLQLEQRLQHTSYSNLTIFITKYVFLNRSF